MKIYLATTPDDMILHWSEDAADEQVHDFVKAHWEAAMPGREIPEYKGAALHDIRQWNLLAFGCLGVDELEMPETMGVIE